MTAMSYAAVEQKLRDLPEDCMDDIAEYIDFLLFRRRKGMGREADRDLSGYFGAVKTLGDGLTAQRRMRDEWKEPGA